MHILLSNDDGLMAPGLLAAYASLKERGHRVTICAPDGQRSAASHAVTLRSPVKVAPWALPDGSLGFAVYGSPADSVRLGLLVLAKEPVDMVVSGINDDRNLGYDINYSGTVAGALEATGMGYPAIAISVEKSMDYDWKRAGHVLVGVIDSFSSWNIPQGVAVNVNLPKNLTTSRNEWFWTRPNSTPYNDYYESESHPDGSVMYQLLRGSNLEQITEREMDQLDTDVAHALAGHITLSPISPNSVHEPTLSRLLTLSTT